jgi:hypothetical protein
MIPKSTFALCSKQFFPSLSHFFSLTGTVFCEALLENYFGFFQLFESLVIFLPWIRVRIIKQGDFSMYCIQHCFICRPSDSTVWTAATSALAVRRSNHSARSHPQLG